jgi:hypothetical protein
MAKQKIRNGQAEYGVIHVQEEEMREAGIGVFEASSTEPSRKAKGASPENKMEPEPVNKAAKRAPAKRKAK